MPCCADPTRLGSIVQSDIADFDNVQQRSHAIVQPGQCARLATTADPACRRVDNLETGEPGGQQRGYHQLRGHTYRSAQT